MAICEIGCADGYVISTRSRDKAAIASAMSIFTRSSACFAWNASAITCRGRKLSKTLVRKPDAGDPHVRFDERDLETGLSVTAPDLDSTAQRGGGRLCRLRGSLTAGWRSSTAAPAPRYRLFTIRSILDPSDLQS